jgi:hypothetical protein
MSNMRRTKMVENYFCPKIDQQVQVSFIKLEHLSSRSRVMSVDKVFYGEFNCNSLTICGIAVPNLGGGLSIPNPDNWKQCPHPAK